MQNAALERWTPAARAVSEPLDKLPVPAHVLSGEAVDAARFFEKYYKAERDAQGTETRPGLESVLATGKITPDLAAQILEKQEAFAAAHTQYLLTISREPESPMERAEFVLGELHAMLSFLFDDGVEDDDDARLAVLNEQHRSAFSQDARAAVLEGYAALAERRREAFAALGVDPGLTEEARALARQLREISATKLLGEAVSAQKAALELRNAIATLLYQDIARVRAVARFVFRNHPEVIRKVTSSYERRRRANARKARAGEELSVESVEEVAQ